MPPPVLDAGLGPGLQIVSQDNPKRRQPTRRSGRDPGSRPYARIQSNQESRAGSTIHTLPADSARVTFLPSG